MVTHIRGQPRNEKREGKAYMVVTCRSISNPGALAACEGAG